MIRSLIVLGSALFALSAYATPKVGDYALFAATISANGRSIPATIELEILREEGEGKFLQRQTNKIGDQDPQSNDEVKPVDQFISDATIDALLADCAGNGGTLETVTVPAGDFNSCKLPFDNEESTGTAWVSKVPFGLARIDSKSKQNGYLVSSQLKTFR
ncbi:MAG: hypothetical protein ACXWQO_03290 [Bdellovibrionota bacterium]